MVAVRHEMGVEQVDGEVHEVGVEVTRLSYLPCEFISSWEGEGGQDPHGWVPRNNSQTFPIRFRFLRGGDTEKGPSVNVKYEYV